jgi:hypothetical protein
VPAEQTYLDIGQGNRIFDSLYDEKLPEPHGCGPAWWQAVEERAASAPAEIVPGLLTSTFEAAGIGVRVGGGASCTFSHRSLGGTHPHPAKSFEVRSSTLRQLSSLVEELQGDDLLIAIERPPPAKDRALVIGIAGRGFDGDLTSDSTRTDGYVLSTDVAPTILQRLGVPVPSEMLGQPIRSEGSVDPTAIESLGERMATISERRGLVIGLALAIWLGALVVVAIVSRGRAGRRGVKLTGLSVVYLPLLLLLGATLEPSQGAEALLVGLGAPLLALATLSALGGYRALALAAAATVLAYAVDVVVGSPLTSLSLLGPNPGLGVRFYGIGNELEALLAVLVIAGTGAALSARGALGADTAPNAPQRRAAVTFLAVGLLAAAVFAAGRFGADVGAAIVLPLGAAAAAATVAGGGRRTSLLVLAVPLAAVALLVLADLLSGADAHLTRSVLDAGGLGDLADVAQRRLQLSAHSFGRPVVFVFLPLIAAVAVLAVARRERLSAWLEDSPTMRAGLIGATVATVAGTLANDSGALLLEIGSAYLLVFLGYAWAESPGANRQDIS